MRDSNPGEGLLHPVPLVAMGLFALNDHVLKSHYPGVLSGKLSDMAGLVFFPLLLQGCWEGALHLVGRPTPPRFLAWGLSAVLTAVVFGAIQVHPGLAAAWQEGLGLAQWPFRGLWAWIQGTDLPAVTPVRHTMDPSDLWTLPFLLLGAWPARTRATQFRAGNAQPS